MKFEGKAHRFVPNDDMNELAKHVMEDISPGFAKKVATGDFIVAGRNFGCGSSREQAPRALKAAGVSAVLAKSYARIFYRSSFNVGLPLIECDTDWIKDGEGLIVDLGSGMVRGSDREVKAAPIPKTMQTLLRDGGLIPHLKKHGGFLLE